jgi:hypothetical protein
MLRSAYPEADALHQILRAERDPGVVERLLLIVSQDETNGPPPDKGGRGG